MGSQRTSFAKLQRDRAKKAKAAAKREMRQERTAAPDEEGIEPVSGGDHDLSAPELLALIEQIHNQYEAKQISQDDFEERKADLLSRLPID
ncbi:MAG TPA: hypothetical protein VNT56_06695 [Acidimicrobiales bacterium]|jgi:hypothetical protein|nr:hypothetical protein [Acidimicrobiales bacterium]